jgi:hypothetical protein
MEFSQEEGRMKVRQALLGALAAAVTVTSIAVAGPGEAKQRVAIISKGTGNASGGSFVLTPAQPGSLKRDSGTASAILPSERVVMRGGQRISIYDPVFQTFKGKRGSLTIRSRIEYADAANGYHAGMGTWKVVRGTGDYSHTRGGGRSAGVYLDRGPWSGRSEGFLTRSNGA